MALNARSARGQEQSVDPGRSHGLNVFIDCSFTCDQDFFRTQIPVVNYARDRTDADVHVLLSSETTGGGTEYRATFIGLNRFKGSDATLRQVAPQTATDDERRNGLTQLLKLGLVRYMADTELADQVRVEFVPDVSPPGPVDDPWNLWVFRTTFGGTLGGERSTSGRSVRAGVSANRTSEAWKVTAAMSGNYRDDTFELSDMRQFRSISRTLNFTGIAVRSLTEHWSAGVHANAASSTFLNYDLRTRVAPGVEYNFFPYSESTRRMLTLQYTVGLGQADYRQETIFGETSEQLIDHRAGLSLTLLQPWGTGTAEVSLSQLLNRPDQYNATAFGSANVRVFRGLSFNVFATLSRTNDQIYLPRSDASTEEILVRERQLATSYRYSINFGLTYSFGSKFNNVVNQRFGAVGDELSEF
jgi:hypothetical protein